MKYKGKDIEILGNGYTVFYHGDEVYFDTIEGAMEFIDEVWFNNKPIKITIDSL